MVNAPSMLILLTPTPGRSMPGTLDWEGRATEALTNALRALELDPDHSRAKAYLAEIYFSLDQAERGEALLAELLEDNPDSSEAYRARGLIRQEHRYDFDGALKDITQPTAWRAI